MPKYIKPLAAILTSLSLIGLAATTASADTTPNLSYDDFIQTQGYKDLQAANASNGNYLSTQNGLEMTMVISQPVNGVDTPMSSITVQGTKTGSVKLVATGEGNTYTAYIINGAMYVDMDGYKTSYGPDNISKVLARIPGSSTKMVKFDEIPSSMSQLSADSLFASDGKTSSELLSGLFDSLKSMFKFSEVTKLTTDVGTTYSYDMGLTILGMSSVIHQTYVFDSNSLLTSANMQYVTTTSAGDVTINMAITSKVLPDLVITPPDLTNIITDKVMYNTSNQIKAEVKSTPKANAILSKAKTLAKKTKGQITAKTLTDAAKALKYTTTKITNGVKVSTTVNGVKGSLCITAVKGKASYKNC